MPLGIVLWKIVLIKRIYYTRIRPPKTKTCTSILLVRLNKPRQYKDNPPWNTSSIMIYEPLELVQWCLVNCWVLLNKVGLPRVTLYCVVLVLESSHAQGGGRVLYRCTRTVMGYLRSDGYVSNRINSLTSILFSVLWSVVDTGFNWLTC